MVERKRLPVPDVELSRPALMLAQRFVQRWDLHAQQLDDGTYVCVHEQLNVGHLFAHLRGEITLGAYLLDQESQARFLVLDADDVFAPNQNEPTSHTVIDFRAGLGYTRYRLDNR